MYEVMNKPTPIRACVRCGVFEAKKSLWNLCSRCICYARVAEIEKYKAKYKAEKAKGPMSGPDTVELLDHCELWTKVKPKV